MILIAEDNAEVRRMIRQLIEDIDAQILECSDGGEAIEVYEANLPDFVLMDINMHPVDGLTAAKEILSRHPDAKIIIVSQHQDAWTRETAFAIGVSAFVAKDDLTPLARPDCESRQTLSCKQLLIGGGGPAAFSPQTEEKTMRVNKLRNFRSTAQYFSLFIIAICLFCISPSAVNAATFSVENTNESGPGSLRQAIIDANNTAGADTIVFKGTLNTGPGSITITLTSGQLTITEDVKILGLGASVVIIRRDPAAPDFRILDVEVGATAIVSSVTIWVVVPSPAFKPVWAEEFETAAH